MAMLTQAANLITSAKPPDEDHRVAATTFVQATTTPSHRLSALTNRELFPGMYTLTAKGHIRPIYLPRKVAIPGPDGKKTDMLLTQGSNDASTCRPELVPAEALGNIICLLEEGVDPVPALFANNLGEGFKRVDVATTVPKLASLLPPDKEVHLVILPASILCHYTEEGAFKGPVDEGCIDALDNMLPGSGFWATTALTFRPDLQEAVLESFLADKKVLGKLMPPPRIKSLKFANSPLLTPLAVTEDDEEDVRKPLSAMRKELTEISRGNSPAPVPSTVAGNPDPKADDDLTAVTGIKDKASLSDPIPRKKALAVVTEDELMVARLQLTGLAYDDSSASLSLVPFAADCDYIMQLSGKKLRTSSLCQILQSTAETLSGGDDFLDRKIDFPSIDPLVAALLLNSSYDTTPLVSLDAPTTAKSLFRATFLAADDADTYKAREALVDARDAQLLLGEHESNMVSVRTEIIKTNKILSLESYLTLLANNTVAHNVFFDIDQGTRDSPRNPVIYRVTRRLAKAMSTREVRFWFKMNPSTQQADRFLYWVAHSHNQLLIDLTYNVRQTMCVLAMTKGEIQGIPTTKYAAAIDALEEIEDTMWKVSTGTMTVPQCLLATTHESKAAKRRFEENQLAAAEARKRTKSSDATNPPNAKYPPNPAKAAKARVPDQDRSGCLVYDKKGPMPVIKEEQKERRICAARARKGTACRWGEDCGMIHERDPTKWGKSTLKRWWDHVLATEGLEWDSAVDTTRIKQILGL
jgi:hypothetical protein